MHEGATDGARMGEVRAHERFGAAGGPAFDPWEPRCHLLLQLAAQHVRVASSGVMQHRPDAQQELFRFVESRPGWRTHTWSEPGQQADDHYIPEAARRALYVRLELIDGVVVSRMACLGQPPQGAARGVAPLHPMHLEAGLHTIEQAGITRQESHVEQRQGELGILVLQLLVFESLELVDRAHLVPDGEVGVPQRVQQRAQKALLLGADARAKHDQQVDVRVQAQRATAVAANRAEDNRRAQRADGGCGTDDDSVHAVRERAMGGAAAASCGDFGHERATGFIELTRDGFAWAAMFTRRNAWEPMFCRAWAGSIGGGVERCARPDCPTVSEQEKDQSRHRARSRDHT